jgi:hypothetical protein
MPLTDNHTASLGKSDAEARERQLLKREQPIAWRREMQRLKDQRAARLEEQILRESRVNKVYQHDYLSEAGQEAKRAIVELGLRHLRGCTVNDGQGGGGEVV